jgi:hypothetical protein
MSVKEVLCAFGADGSTCPGLRIRYGPEHHDFQFGTTNVNLSSGFLDALQTLSVTPGVIGPTQLAGTQVNFPIIGGAIDLDTALGNKSTRAVSPSPLAIPFSGSRTSLSIQLERCP